MPAMKKPTRNMVKTPGRDDLDAAISFLELGGTVMGGGPESDSCALVARWLRGESERIRQVDVLAKACADMGLSIPEPRRKRPASSPMAGAFRQVPESSGHGRH